MKTNEFLNREADERGLMAKEFAEGLNISISAAKKLLSPGVKYLPSDALAKRIVEFLKLSPEEEEKFWKLLAEDREELEQSPPDQPDEPNELLKEIELLKDRVSKAENELNELGKRVHLTKNELKKTWLWVKILAVGGIILFLAAGRVFWLFRILLEGMNIHL